MDKPESVRGLTDRPSAARIYDYLLGGYHNFESDRAAAEQFRALLPNVPLYMQANRAFLRRAVSYLVELGVDQFLDIGSGIPTVGNVHEVAQQANPEARVVYVDMDPVAVRHSEEILKENPNATVVEADLRDTGALLNDPELRRMLDFERPVAVLLLSVLLFLTEDEEAYGVVRALGDAVIPGSYLAISHPTDDDLPKEQVEKARQLYAATGNPVSIRSYEQIKAFFDGFELVEPGLVYVSRWRPEDSQDLFFDHPESSGYYAAIGRKP